MQGYKMQKFWLVALLGLLLFASGCVVSKTAIENRINLGDLNNVDENGRATGRALMWKDVNQQWEPFDINFGDVNVMQVCDGDANSIWTSVGICQDITDFYKSGVLITDSNWQTNYGIFDANMSLRYILQSDGNAWYAKLSDINTNFLKTDGTNTMQGDLNAYRKIWADGNINAIGIDSNTGWFCFRSTKSSGAAESLCFNLGYGSNAIQQSSNTGVDTMRTDFSQIFETNKYLIMGTNQVWKMRFNSNNADHLQISLATGSTTTLGSGLMTIIDSNDTANNNRAPSQAFYEPHLRIYGSNENDANDFIDFFADGNQAYISAGKAILNILGTIKSNKDINATGTIRANQFFDINGNKGLDYNAHLLKDADLIALTKTYCDMNYKGGILIASNC